MIRFPIPIAAGVLCAVLLVAGEARPQVTRFDVQSAFSPNGDPRQATSRIRFALSESASTSLVVYEADSVTAVRTFLADSIAQSGDFFWNGRRDDDTPVLEGPYIVTLSVTDPDSVLSLPVYVDLTAPSIHIVSVLPNPYAPGAPGATSAINFAFTVTNASPTYPWRVADELRTAFTPPGTNPDDIVPVSITITPPYTGQDGNYVLSWDATQEPSPLPEGEFTVTFELNDVAGYTAESVTHFDADTRAPDVKATSLDDNSSLGTVPENLDGYAFDRNGVDSLAVRYGDDRPYRPVTGTVVVDDTLRWSIPLADTFSTAGDGNYFVEFRATDVFDRPTTYRFNFSVDTSSPVAPVLDPAPTTWTTDRYRVTGHAEDGDLGSFVHLYRNGALVDSVSTALGNDFAIDVPLDPGRNDIYAVLRDAAFNVSPPSNTLAITFDSGAGLLGHVPFRPGDSFEVNASRMASRCTVRVFDMSGQIVKILEDGAAKQFYAIAWDGINGSGVGVKKGPLVVVASVDYSDGSRDIFREVFLYDPHAQ